MFDAIAPRYDLLNHLLSAGIDGYWRSRAVRSLGLTGRETLLDVCTGTGDVALAAARLRTTSGRRGAARVVGIDFAAAMLGRGREKVRRAGQEGRVTLVRGDAVRLPARDGCADAVTAAFGIRNVASVESACAEMARVLRPGGRLAILEFSVPRVPVAGAVYRWYFTRVLPRVGRLISGHRGAYAYLPASVGAFQPPSELVALLERSGFREVEAVELTLGIVQLYTAVRD
jgi:demethylmenaquinone methyltransferase/2-methoxy-6-polyprenyl-1,4-benzoquinol methylase